MRAVRGRTLRTPAVAAVLGAVLVVASGTTLAAAPSRLTAFAGIAGADRPPTARDALDPAAAATVESVDERIAYAPVVTRARQTSPLPPPRLLLPATSRLLGKLPNGSNVYVVASAGGELCIVLDDGTSCGTPLTPAQPTTIGTMDRVVNGPGASPPLSFGIARSGIAAVSFMAGGHERTVAVKNNVWAYVGASSVLREITLHYADGTHETLIH